MLRVLMVVLMSQQQQQQQQQTFHRRKLPESAIAFSSSEGLALFSEALAAQSMGTYFRLAEQFHTQEEPAYCGLASLVMVLNALSVDPGRRWKGAWRWYSEHLLECCKPLDRVKVEGLTLDLLACTGRCNSLDVEVIRGDCEHLEESVRDVIRRTSAQPPDNPTEFLIASYDRRGVGQTGEGHFSPLGGYHAGSDRVLLMDTARFKYPSHWLPVSQLCAAMRSVDRDAGKPRGLLALKRSLVGSPVGAQLLFLDHAMYLRDRRPLALRDALEETRLDDALATPTDAARRVDRLVSAGAIPRAVIVDTSCCHNTDALRRSMDKPAQQLGIVEPTDNLPTPAHVVLTLFSIPDRFWRRLASSDDQADALVALLNSAIPKSFLSDAEDLRRRMAHILDYYLDNDE
ncbi:hypothetical protein CTAYLR_008026 [Chrysophaeum taylorii]|uniref:glutathione gamma-glutamylcysteinyltransferase n=1 Tax=Chrysophaeum taylorii TaxID=2483200 RepID=A0AAD7U7C0_9STRA|nr:hypothetical protein CTAYLR_008026 [Chrysophaeum taylorii]